VGLEKTTSSASSSSSSSPFALTAEERAPLSIAVSRRLREAIVTGKVEVGTELPSEKELAKELGVGRSTVREALRILQAQGLLSGGDTVSTHRPRVSAEQALQTAGVTMENVLRLGRIPLKDLIELRVLIEGAAVEQAAEATSDDERNEALEGAREAVRTMKGAAIDIDAFRAADIRFHKSLVAASGNLAYPLVMSVLREAISGHLGEALHKERDPKSTMATLTQEHEAILEAVESRKGKRARTLIGDHIRGFYEKRNLVASASASK
jgi:GntR family transcriptional regulator, transcriptional repressor for pyruvate dehydrogenase complex